ncbi:FKBP-type peptidyl-prolyl cis-trans isomerase SlyD [Methanosarcina sp. MTP4]|uniref:FKBP-type peptidyl-prolyl cis-trans isomerase n=1 Tax=Methanosarcina sp. MTP4 TaxID=1434100 RepID=UPI000615CD24|nr:peptidylprolyl isomerase [Methanosarcina sp. MTP4]AKB25765.1 FKBP-type peptidyl-prolyl cis-trans isomerase SlyD [Methanosarcina sp. MTP4]
MKTGRGVLILGCILIVACVLLGSGCTDTGNDGQAGETAKAGDTVHVDYVGKLEDGTVFDTSIEEVAVEAGIYIEGREYSPLTFEAGAGQMITGFDEGVIGMKVGEEKTLTIPPEDAYGEYDEANIQAVPLEDLGLPEPPVEGQKLMTMYGTRVTVLSVNETHATIDFNHELAGKTLIFDITLVSIESS